MRRRIDLVPLAVACGLVVATLLTRALLASGPVVPGDHVAVAAAPSDRVSPAGNLASLKVRSEGTKDVDVPNIDSNSCETENLNVKDANSDDLTFLFPDKDFTDNGPLSLLVNGKHDSDEISYTVCNSTGNSINPPDGTWSYLVAKP